MIWVYMVLVWVVVVVIYMLIKAASMKPEKVEIGELHDIKIDTDRAVASLSEAIKCKTISRPNPDDVDWAEFDKLREHIKKAYPLVHSKLEMEVIAEHSLLFTWKGSDESLKPVALLAHMDVVPVMPGTEDEWEHDAFSGHVDGEFVWGRGTLDMKHQFISILEAAETLLAQDTQPKRTVYLSFGHNEEVVGSSGGGAQAIAQTLFERGIRLGAVIDEGGAIVPGKTFSIEGDIGMVGICEKGYADVKITSRHPGGHASQPPRNNGLVQVCDAVVKLDNNQFKKRLIKPVEAMFSELGKYMGFGMRFVLANLWITKPLLLAVLSKGPLTNAMVRTTIAPTMAEGSPAGNVLPQSANVSVNFRMLQGERTKDVLEHIKKVSKNEDLNLEVLRGKEPSAISPTDNAEFELIKSVTRKVHGEIPVAPYLMVGGTDSCFFECVTDNIYCICPFKLETEDLARIHGTNERIEIKQIENGVRFFAEVILDYCM